MKAKKGAVYGRDLFIPVLCAVFILLLILFSKTSVNAAKKGIDLWLYIVFPSLFPFFVGVEILSATGIIRVVGVLLEPIMRPLFNLPGLSSFPFAMGIASGYPVGAKITASLREQKLLTKNEAERLMAFSNNSGPLFIMGAVSVGMYNMPSLGIMFLLCHIAACITVGVIYGLISRLKHDSKPAKKIRMSQKLRQEYHAFRKNRTQSFGGMLGSAIVNSIMTILAIGGFIIVFSVIINILLDTGVIAFLTAIAGKILSVFGMNNDILSSLFCGFFEITTGSSMASTVSSATLLAQLTATSAIIGWAGLSVHCQVFSIASKTDISMKPYLLGKFLQGTIAAIYTYGWIKIAGKAALSTKPASLIINSIDSDNSLLFNYSIFSIEYIVIGVAIILICVAFSLFAHTFNKPDN